MDSCARKRKRLLDLGCGTGHDLARWRSEGYSCAGLDAAEEMVSEARARNPGMPIQLGDCHALPFPDCTFEIVVAIELLRYLADVPKALGEIRRVLQPSGVFIGTVMSPFSLSGYPLVNLITSRLSLPGFVRLRQHFHSRRRLASLLESEAFYLQESRGVCFITMPQKIAERIAPPLFRFSLRLTARVDGIMSKYRDLSDFGLHLVFRAARRA